MNVVEFALKHNLRQKILFTAPIISVLALISAVISVFESNDIKITAFCVSIFIVSIVARIYTKQIDPDTFEFRD